MKSRKEEKKNNLQGKQKNIPEISDVARLILAFINHTPLVTQTQIVTLSCL